jgi:ubiquinone/menaquinone biosynthesis C-methylase UbiE
MYVSPAPPVNHHADYPAFAGFSGTLAGLSMLLTGHATARLAMQATAVSGADHIVDIGCGPGTAARAAAGRGAWVTGIDPAPVMLRLARRLTRNKSRITWLQGTAEDLPLPDASATVVWSLASVHHWKDVTAGLAEIRRVLVPHGWLLAIERRVRPAATGLASHGWTDQQIQSFVAQCRAAGFHAATVNEHAKRGRALWVVQAQL